MGTPALTPIANTTLASTASTVTFSGISQGFRDLVLVSSIKVLAGPADVYMTFNSNVTTGNEHSRVYMVGTGSAASSGTNTNIGVSYYTYPTATNFSSDVVNIFDYSTSDKHKSWISRVSTDGLVVAYTGRWANNSPITSIHIGNSSSTSFVAGSTFSLFGVIA